MDPEVPKAADLDKVSASVRPVVRAVPVAKVRAWPLPAVREMGREVLAMDPVAARRPRLAAVCSAPFVTVLITLPSWDASWIRFQKINSCPVVVRRRVVVKEARPGCRSLVPAAREVRG